MERNFEQMADNFLNFDGTLATNPDNMIGGDNYYKGAMNPAPYHHSMAGANNGLGTVPESDRTLTCRIENTSGGLEEARVFGAYTNPNNTQPAGVTVQFQETSHDQVRAESASNPLLIVGLKYIVTNTVQFQNNISLFRQTSTGGTAVETFQPFSFRSAQNFQAQQIDAPGYAFYVDGKTEWRVPINDGEVLTFIFFISTRGDLTRILEGRPVVDTAKAPAPTGYIPADYARGARG